MEKHENKSETATLRQKAENLLKTRTEVASTEVAGNISATGSENIKLRHELQVQKIELELQYAELCHAMAVAEAALDKGERHRGLSEASFEAIFIFENGVCIEQNQTAEVMFGYTMEEAAGRYGTDWIVPEFREMVMKKMIAGDEQLYEAVALRKDGTTFPCVLCGKRIHYKGRDVWVTSLTDITDRKKAEQEVNRVSARLALAAKAGGVGIWDFDVINNILIWDDQMFAIYGVAKENFSGAYEAWLKGIHPDDMERGDAEIRMAIRGEKEFDTEFRVCWPNGSVHHIRAIANVQRDDSGKVVRMIGTNWDITEEKRLEERLKSSEANFRTFFETINDLIIVGNIQGRIIYANDAVYRKLGYKDGELQGRHVHDLHPVEKRAEAVQIFTDMLAGKLDFCPLPLARTDGSVLPVETRVWTGKWDGNDCIFGISKDLSKEQEALQKFNTIFNSNPSLMAITSIPEGDFTDVNEAFLAKTGYAKSEVIGKTANALNLFIQPEKQQNAADELADVGFLSDLELQIKTKSGNLLDGLFSGVTLESQGQKFFLTVMADITDKKQATQAIKISEKKYRTMLHASPEAILLLDLNGIITEVSEIGLQLFGANTRDELVSENIFQFVNANERELLQDLFEMTLSEGLAQNIGLTIKRRNQSLFQCEISATLMQDPDGVPVSFMIIIHDITQRKEMEAKQIHVDRMATLGEMAAGMAHEINQPLNIISLVMDKILIEIAKPGMADAGFLINKSNKIFENIHRIRDIIDHVRSFSRNQDDYLDSAFNVNSSILNATSMIMEQFKHLNIDLNLQLGQHITMIVGNTYKFEQVILNLLANAKDAVIEKGTKAEEDFKMFVGVRSWQENRSIFIEISDNGIGINQDDIHHIMLPFFTTKEEGKGTGLGLPICYRIIKEMNGTIEIASDKSYGTHVTLVLPVQLTT